MKKCSKCKKLLPFNEFNWKIKGVKRAYCCKNCSREYIHEHYENNTDYYLNKARKRNLAVRAQSQKYIGKYLLTHPCVDCGERDILVLEFDHKDRGNKLIEISKMIKNRGTLAILIQEIQKCDVRCANCHRRKTAIEDNSWKLKYAPVA